MLKVSDLKQTLARRAILHGISFSAPAGTVIAFLGPNGAVKTTLLKTVMGLYPLAKRERGAILLNGTDVTTLPVHERVAHGLLYVPQFSSLFSQLTVWQNLSMVYDYHPHWRNEEKKAFENEVDTLLKQTNLEQCKHQKARFLSGGQQRKVEVIRALLMRPKVILFDEPFAGVDPKSIYELKKLFVEMAKNGIAVVISDHHVDQLLSIATSVYVIINGQVVTSGSIQDIMSNKHLKEQYLGSQFHKEVAERFLA